jgi:hypothetical protein
VRRGRQPICVWLPAVASFLAAGACSGGPAIINYPTPPASAPTTTTTVFDFGSVDLAGVSGRTTTTIDNRPGKAHLAGTVTGPDGPVPLATVHIERLVGDAVLAKDVTTGPDGGWRLDLIRGGRYRVRAWRAPDLSQVDPQILYLGSDETRSLALTLAIVNEPAILAVAITTASVDPQGVVRGVAQGATTVQILAGFGEWRIESSALQTTDAGGYAQWRLTCLAPGPRALSVIVGTSTPLTLTIPPCDDGTGSTVRPVPSTAPPAPPATTPRTTTTTRAAGP